MAQFSLKEPPMPIESSPRPTSILVCVGPSPSSADVIRAVQKMAAELSANWVAVYVETPKMLRLPTADRNRAVSNLRLAEQLGAEAITLRGGRIAAEIVEFARHHQVAKIVAGTPRHRWGDLLFRSPVDDLVRLCGEIEIIVTAGAPEERKQAPALVNPKPLRLPDYEVGLIYIALATVLCFLIYPYFDLPNLIMVYLLAVLITAVHCGRGPAILNALLGVLAFEFCFVPPRWSFTVEDAKYVVTFVVMFLVAAVIGQSTSVIKRQAEAARLQERQTATLHALSRDLARSRGVTTILAVAVQHVSSIFQCEVVALLPDDSKRLHAVAGDMDSVFHQHILKEMSVAQRSFETGQIAGWGTQDSQGAENLYVPLQAGDVLGVLALRPTDPQLPEWLLPEQLRLRLLESLAKEVALALGVERLQKAGSDPRSRPSEA
jgi:two-component system sensor histidine kinase KdpD